MCHLSSNGSSCIAGCLQRGSFMHHYESVTLRRSNVWLYTEPGGFGPFSPRPCEQRCRQIGARDVRKGIAAAEARGQIEYVTTVLVGDDVAIEKADVPQPPADGLRERFEPLVTDGHRPIRLAGAHGELLLDESAAV